MNCECCVGERGVRRDRLQSQSLDRTATVTCVYRLRELEPLACLRTAGLLALDRAGIAREEAEVAKLAAMRLVDLHERAGDGEAQRAGLTGLAAAVRRSP